MTSTPVSPIPPRKTAERDGFLEPALYVSIAIAIFAVVTQLLAATGATSLSTTQQLTMWAVAAGLIVLLWIAYMICRAYVTARSEKAEAEKARAAEAEANARLAEAKAVAEKEAKAAQEQIAQARQDAGQQKDRAERAEAEAEKARAAEAEANARLAEAKAVAEKEAKAAQEQIAQARQDAGRQKGRAERAEAEAEHARAGAEEANVRLAKALVAKAAEQDAKDARGEPAQVRQDGKPPENPTDGSDQFAPGWVPPDELRHLDGTERSVITAKVFPHGCYLEPESISPAVDKLTGQPVYQCTVVDRNPALKDRPHETVVKILADQKPSPPPGPRYTLVEFDGLTITPHETDRSPIRIAYSLSATGIHRAGGGGARPGDELMTVADGRRD